LPDASEFPPRPAYYDAFLAASPPPPSSRATPHSHPIFYMAPGAQVGETLALHFFEPRYKLLIQRAWSSDKIFVFCRDAPFANAALGSYNLPLSADPPTDGCVNVRVDSASFDNDGSADIVGVAIESVVLTDVVLEPATGGLFSLRLARPLDTPAPLPPAPTPESRHRPCRHRHGASTLVGLSLLFFVGVSLAFCICSHRPASPKLALRFCPEPTAPLTSITTKLVATPTKLAHTRTILNGTPMAHQLDGKHVSVGMVHVGAPPPCRIVKEAPA